MTPPSHGVAVNTRNSRPEVWPRWRYDKMFAIELPPGEAVRVPQHVGVTLLKKFPGVRFMTAAEYERLYKKRPKLVVTRSVGIGDILMLKPSLRALQEEGWEIHLAVLDAFRPIVENNPCITKVLSCGLNGLPKTDIRSKLNLNMRVERVQGAGLKTPRAKIFERLVGVTVPADKRKPVLILSDSWRREAARLIPEGAIGICVKTSTTHRDYPHVQELATELTDRGHTVVLIHHEPASKTGVIADRESIIDLQGKIGCGTMCAVIERLSALVTPDTGPMHVALTLDIPCVCIEGPTMPSVYLWSYGDAPKKVLQKSLKCAGCWHLGSHALNCSHHGCKDHECMDWPPKEVADAAEEIARGATVNPNRKAVMIHPDKPKAPPPPAPAPAPKAPAVVTKAKVWLAMLYQDEPISLMERFVENVIQNPAIGKVVAVNGAGDANGLSTMLRKTGKVDIYNVPYPCDFFGAQANQRNASFMPVPAGTPILMMDPDEEMSPALCDWLPEFPGSRIPFAEIARMDWNTKADGARADFTPRWGIDPKAERDWQPRLFHWQLHWHWYRAAHHILLGPPPAQRLPDNRFIMHFRGEIANREARERLWDSQMAENEACIGGQNGMG